MFSPFSPVCETYQLSLIVVLDKRDRVLKIRIIFRNVNTVRKMKLLSKGRIVGNVHLALSVGTQLTQAEPSHSRGLEGLAKVRSLVGRDLL